MKIRRRARLDPSQISDRRGLAGGAPIAVGGGLIGLIALVVIALVNGGLAGSDGAPADQASSDLSACRTGADVQQTPIARSSRT